jgi:hypothetical protein
MRRVLLAVAVSALVAVLASSRPAHAADEVVVYSARHYGQEPAFDAFTRATGVAIRMLTGDAGQMFERLKTEGDRSPADVLLTVDAGNLWNGWTQDSEDVFHHVAWIFLDQALGEHTVVMRVGMVEAMAPTEELLAQSRPMSELATLVDAWPSSAHATGRPGARYPVEPAEEVWTVLQGTDDGTPLTARRNDAAEQLMMHADYRHRVTVTVPFREPNHAGFPEREGLNTIGTIEDTVRDALEAGQAALLTLAVAGGGKRSLVFYSRAPELAEAAVHGVRGRFPSHGIFVQIDEDAAWSEYRTYLAAGDAK